MARTNNDAKGHRERRMKARYDDLVERSWELIEDDTDLRESEGLNSKADLHRMGWVQFHALIENYFECNGSEDTRILGFLFTDYRRWMDCRFELQVWHYTAKPDEDDPEIEVPHLPIHHRDRIDKDRCLVCRGEGGMEIAHVYDQYGSLVGRGNDWGIDESLDLDFSDLGYEMTGYDMTIIGEIISNAFH